MATPGVPLSAAVQLAWQIAADEAVHARHNELEPDHLLLGICGMPKAFSDGVPDKLKGPAGTVEQARGEWQVVSNSLATAKIDPASLRRELRKRLPAIRPPSASPAATIRRSVISRQVFARAGRYAGSASSPSVQLAHLLAAVLDEDRSLAALLRGFDQNVDALRSALGVPLLRESEGVTPAFATVSDPAPEERIVASLDATLPLVRSGVADSADRKRLGLFFDLPRIFDPEHPAETHFQQVLERVLEAIPSARRGALLLLDPKCNDLLLKAHVPLGSPAVSMTSARWSIQERRAFVWKREQDLTASQQQFGISSGIYAPLISKDEAVGVLFVENPERDDAFTAEDMNLLVTVANHLAMTLANERLQAELRRNTLILQRLLTNFSPKVRDRLLERARHGKLRLGGEKSEVTILMSDIRGFTRTTASMDSGDVVDMLNQYLSVAATAVFEHDGTVDKFIGDAVLAVFGSPDPDPQHHQKAVLAALQIQAQVQKLNERRKVQGSVQCHFGVGVHCGEVLHGFIGTDDRMEYTVIGVPVNRVSRYSQAAGPGDILVSPELYQHVWRLFNAEKKMIPTKHEGEIVAFSVIAPKDATEN